MARVGNEPTASVSGVDVPMTAFLLKEDIQNEGVVFAFSAFFRSNKPVRFQIWRPYLNGNHTENEFQLRAEIKHLPSIELAREDVSEFHFFCPFFSFLVDILLATWVALVALPVQMATVAINTEVSE